MYIHRPYLLEPAGQDPKLRLGRREPGSYSRHDVTPFEVEEVAGRTAVVIPAKAVHGENRWKLFGNTHLGACLVVVFTIRRKLFRAVTAFEMNLADRRNYAPHID